VDEDFVGGDPAGDGGRERGAAVGTDRCAADVDDEVRIEPTIA
jgi:hypothetical protein